ncbi:MAG: 50S ribosomal protein L17 [Bacteroidia bacterium]|nr:50S ribosomal protein L17 [Bacteroidia bacterium]
MRHGNKVNHLGRTYSHRKALLANLSISLLIHKRIRTTLAKAKELRVYVEPLITKSKTDTTHSRRVVFSYLQNKDAIKELFGPIAEKVADRPGGYTRILKLGPRPGDNAEMALIELVDFNEYLEGEKLSSRRAKKKRSRRSSGKKQGATAAETAAPVTPAPQSVIETVEPEEVADSPADSESKD